MTLLPRLLPLAGAAALACAAPAAAAPVTASVDDGTDSGARGPGSDMQQVRTTFDAEAATWSATVRFYGPMSSDDWAMVNATIFTPSSKADDCTYDNESFGWFRTSTKPGTTTLRGAVGAYDDGRLAPRTTTLPAATLRFRLAAFPVAVTGTTRLTAGPLTLARASWSAKAGHAPSIQLKAPPPAAVGSASTGAARCGSPSARTRPTPRRRAPSSTRSGCGCGADRARPAVTGSCSTTLLDRCRTPKRSPRSMTGRPEPCSCSSPAGPSTPRSPST